MCMFLEYSESVLKIAAWTVVNITLLAVVIYDVVVLMDICNCFLH
jgi:hypothetical protein